MAKQVTAATVLRRAKNLIEGGWTRGWYARTSSRKKVTVRDNRAVSFCIYGACERAEFDLHDNSGARQKAVRLLGECLPHPFSVHEIAPFNDTRRSKSEVLAVFDCAIKKAKASKQ